MALTDSGKITFLIILLDENASLPIELTNGGISTTSSLPKYLVISIPS